MKRFGLLFILTAFSISFLPKTLWSLDFSAHGYYRFELHYSHDLDLQTPSSLQQGNQLGNDRFGNINFAEQRFRIEPILKVNDNISFHGTLDILDNVVFGSNDVQQLAVYNPVTGSLTLPGGSGAFGVTGGSAGDLITGGGGSLNVRSIYTDILTPIGKFRIGRQPSNWGLGIFQNDGKGTYDKFGDYFDRLLYLGKYDFRDTSSLAFALLVDFAFAAQEDPTLSLLEGAVPTLSRNTYQFTGALIYQNNVHNFEIGTYTGVRLRNGSGQREGTALDADGNEIPGAVDGNTRLWYLDVYGRWKNDHYSVGLEYVLLNGNFSTGVCIDAIANQPGFVNPLPTPVCLDGSNDILVNMGALEVAGKYDFGGEWQLKTGFAQGDSSPLSSVITQFGFRKDYNIALMLFNMPLGTSPAIQLNGQTVLGNQPITSNQVNNAIYASATYAHNFDISNAIPQSQGLKIGATAVTAFAPSRVVDIDFGEIVGISTLPRVTNRSKWYGMEFDVFAEAKFFDHLTWNITGGVFLPGGVFDIKNDDFQNNAIGNPINAIQFDPASMAYAMKTTLFIEY
ncbi:MAG: hypothetical protein KDK66_03130 [Deltaproteobacteria bacterium]|nr:hypothetical protein [Deltaproteobacteria bacterium]